MFCRHIRLMLHTAATLTDIVKSLQEVQGRSRSVAAATGPVNANAIWPVLRVSLGASAVAGCSFGH